MQNTHGFATFVSFIKRYIVIIISLTLMGGIIAGAVTFYLLTPKYSSRAQVLIALPEKNDVSVQIEEVNVNLQMVETYKSLILGDLVLEQTQAKLANEQQVELTAKELLKSLRITQDENSMLLNITATCTKPQVAEQIATATTEVFQEISKEMIHSNEIIIISKAKANNSPIFPNNPLNILIGLILGLMFSIGGVFFHHKWKKNEADKSSNTLRYNYRVSKMLDS